MDQSHEVEGAVLVMHEYTELSAARDAAESLGIKLHELDATESFLQIKENFVSEYTHGRTPNPCVVCNERVKFKKLFDYAMEHGFDAIATGHYAKIVEVQGNRAFAVAEDTKKDQTYMLYRLPENILAKLILPLSEGRKTQIREEAESAGISAAKRSDSQEICFLPNGGHGEYIESVSGKCQEGDFVDENGKILGRHRGIIHYTVGQRKGLGIALGSRAFITDIDPKTNRITLSTNLVGKITVNISGIVYSGFSAPKEETIEEFEVKLRYGAKPVPTVAHLYPDGRAVLTLSTPQTFAPGQSAVLYRDGVVMLGGFID
jgi:tRNA-specific 2-thiouridylase